MRVVVPTVVRGCPASQALHAEGIEHEEILCDPSRDTDYGAIVASKWQRGEGFIIVEHDIVPWPGALQAMWNCPMHWCGYQYPYFTGHPAGSPERLFGSHGMGCVKFSDALVKGWPDLATEGTWDQRHWRALDGVVGKSITQALVNDNVSAWHAHTPPVAHLRLHAWKREG